MYTNPSMNAKNIHIKSFGCQMNKLDTAMVGAAVKEAGYQLIDDYEQADIVLLNTCSVRERAEKKVFSHLGRLKRLKEDRPELIVGVIGCMAQRLGDELLEHEAVNIVCGPAQISEIVTLIGNALSERENKKYILSQYSTALEPYTYDDIKGTSKNSISAV